MKLNPEPPEFSLLNHDTWKICDPVPFLLTKDPSLISVGLAHNRVTDGSRCGPYRDL